MRTATSRQGRVNQLDANRRESEAGVQPPTDPSRSTSIRLSSGLGQPAARGEDAAWTPPREAARPDERSFVEGGIRSSALRLSCRLAPTQTWRLVQRWAPLRLPGRRRELEASVVRQSPGLHFGARVRGEVNWALSKGLRLRVRPSALAGKVLTLIIGQPWAPPIRDSGSAAGVSQQQSERSRMAGPLHEVPVWRVPLTRSAQNAALKSRVHFAICLQFGPRTSGRRRRPA